MKFFLDTEFIEDGKTIDLISIGIVSDNDDELYLINLDCDLTNANDWVKDNVIPKLETDNNSYWKSKRDIQIELLKFVIDINSDIEFSASLDTEDLKKLKTKNKPQFWGYYCSYDWVVLCQLFGRMIDLPNYFPMYINDLKQLANFKGNPKLPKSQNAHNALEDAKWCKEMFYYLNDYAIKL